MLQRLLVLLLVLLPVTSLTASDYKLYDHPRIFVNPQTLPDLAAKATGPLSAEYGRIKALAEGARKTGLKF